MATPSYVNADTIRAATAMPATVKADKAIARAIDDGSRAVERLCGGRLFYPTSATRTMDWPDSVNTDSRKLWLDGNEAVSISAISVDGTALTSWRVGPDVGPPYRWVETDLSTAETWTSHSTTGHQDPVSITGVFAGCDTTTATAGALNGAIATTTATTVAVTDGSDLSVGDCIKVDDEWMIITATAFADTSENLGSALTLDASDATIAVTDGATYAIGELLRVGRERLLIEDIASNDLYVVRKQHGTSIAAHSLGADIYVRRTLTVERGQLGTTAATHTDATAISRLVPPAGVTSLALAEALVVLANENAAYARTVGSGESEREARGGSIENLRKRTKTRYGRIGGVYATGRG